jgi:dimeric dUTPase (all-alpha-NTP-PPase superfamily)
MSEVLDLTELFSKQSGLDQMYNEKFGVVPSQIIKHKIRALKSEFGEAQAKWGGFKYWSVRPKYTRDEILEECVDMLHFYLSIGNFLKVPLEHASIDRRKDQFEHLDAMDYSLLFVGEAIGWYMSFALFRGMLLNWGFNWDEVIAAYDRKNQINYERQEKGY